MAIYLNPPCLEASLTPQHLKEKPLLDNEFIPQPTIGYLGVSFMLVAIESIVEKATGNVKEPENCSLAVVE